MKITNLSINHYKTVEEPIEISKFLHFHILIGPNNSGKTNLLDAIEFLWSPDLDPERFYDESADLSLTSDIGKDGVLKIAYKDNKRSFILNNDYVTGENNIIKDAQKRIIRVKPNISADFLIKNYLRDFKDRHKDEYSDFCSTLQDYFDDMEISENLFLESVSMDRKERPVVRMGDGFRRLFIMLFYIFHPDFDIILIDEPELHLHPTVIKKFLKVLIDKKFDNQVFLTTHSSIFVTPKHIEYIWRIARDENRNTKVYTIFSSKNTPISKDRLVQELNSDNTEMFFADKVLLVEGVSDRILMRGLIDRFYRGRDDIKVVYTGSKGNVDIYADLCRSFNINYLVMLDRDALTGSWSHLLSSALKGHHKDSIDRKINILKSKNIYILEGTLEQSYSKVYQKKDTKPLNALRAANLITWDDLNSKKMKVIKEIIDNL